MVYGGKPSTGCHLCRKRKIKCDEALPGCRNCLVYGRPCPGYRLDTIFRHETSKIKRLVKRAGSSPPVNQQRHQQGTSLPPSSSTLQVVDSSWEQRAVCYFFDQYTTNDSDDCFGQFSFLPDLYSTVCREDNLHNPAADCLRFAVDATALIALSNHVKAPALTVRARERYGKALRGLQHALNSQSQAVKDETFATIALLSLFEDITGERNGLSSSHSAGIELLLKLRGGGQLGHARGRDLFHFAYAQTHVEILALGEKPRYDIDSDWILEQLRTTTDPAERLIIIASKISRLVLASAPSLQASSSPTSVLDANGIAKLTSWIETGRQINLELTAWSQELPERWLPLIVYSQRTGKPLITYQHVSMAAIWNYYRAVRIIFHQFMLELRRTVVMAMQGPFSETGVPLGDPEAGTPTPIIQKLITDVCRSLPYSFGEVDTLGNPSTSTSFSTSSFYPTPSSSSTSSSPHSPTSTTSTPEKPRVRAVSAYSMIWPVWYILSCGFASPTQAQQLRNFLAQIGSVLGIKLALVLARDTSTQPQRRILSTLAGR